MTNASPTPVKSAMRTLDVIEFVAAHRRGVVPQDIANALDIPMSSLSYLLATLTERQYLRREARRYFRGPWLERLCISDDDMPLENRMAPIIKSLCMALNETVSFMIRDGWEAQALVTEASGQSLRYAIDPGAHKPLHALAAGKAILSALSPQILDRYFAESHREAFTAQTIVSETALRAQLDQVRETGFAEAMEEITPGVCSIGTLIRIDGQPVGGIGIAVPTIRFSEALRTRARALLADTAVSLAPDT